MTTARFVKQVNYIQPSYPVLNALPKSSGARQHIFLRGPGPLSCEFEGLQIPSFDELLHPEFARG